MKPLNPKIIAASVLFSGGLSENLKERALLTAKQLLCVNSTACGICQSCLWMSKGYHPDLLWLPLDAEDKISIAEIRLASQHLSHTAHQGKCKIVVLSKADSLSIGAMNALLKTLEEPPLHSYIFLLSEYPHLLPATIRSRCQKIRLPLLKKSSTEQISHFIETLKNLRKKTISVFEAAEKWQKVPLIEILDGLYYALLESRSYKKNLFIFWDKLNKLREQVLHKQNPNSLLALESLFYQWIM